MSFAITAAPRLAPRATTASVRATSNARASCSAAATATRRSVGRAAARAGRPPAVVSRWSRRARDANVVVDAWARTIARANVLGDGTARADDDEDEDEDDDDEVADSKRASVQLPRTRRRVQMTFTCNKCEGRTMRMINPDVLERGTMWVQCGQCEVWHQVVDNLGLIFDFTGDYEELKDKIKNARRMKPDE